MMIEVTVKTLDSNNHSFNVSESLTIKEFKEEISPTVGIPVEEQRLIFRGRILQNDKKISDYNLTSNTVLHLVQRPQNAGVTGDSNQNDEPTRNTREQAAANAMGRIPASRTRNSAAVRLQIATDMISKASSLIQKLEDDDEIAAATRQAAASSASSSTSSTATDENQEQMEIVATDDPNALGHVMNQVANAATAVFVSVHTIHSGGSDGSDDDDIPAFDGQNTTMRTDEISSTSNQAIPSQESPRLRELATSLQDIMAFHERLTPFLLFVQNILQENSLFNTDTGELRSIQYVYDTVASILHYLGHSYHAYSDLLCDFSIPPESRRLSAHPQLTSFSEHVVPVSFGVGSNVQQQQEAQSTASIPSLSSTSQNVPLSQTSQPSIITTGGGLNFSQIQSGLNVNADSNGSGNQAAGNANNPFANLQESIRNHMMRPSFDILLPCQSHHTNQQNRTRERPTDLHKHVKSQMSCDVSSDEEGTSNFFEIFVELIRCSNWLNILHPYFKDFIQNYLMRGRNSTNSQHIKTCARSLAKKLLPFFQCLTDTIVVKNGKVAYENTYTEFLSNFCFKLFHIVLNTNPTDQIRTPILLCWEEYMSQLFSIFRHCFPNNNRVPEIVANLIVDQYFVGMPIVFRKNAKKSLEKYFIVFSSSAERHNMDAHTAGVIYKSDEELIDDEISATVAPNMAKLSTTHSVVEETKITPSIVSPPVPQVSTSSSKIVEVPFTGDTMETEIDDLFASPLRFSGEAAAAKNESLFRHIPTEWRDTVRHDIQRQMGMSDPLPPSRGFFALFPRRD